MFVVYLLTFLAGALAACPRLHTITHQNPQQDMRLLFQNCKTYNPMPVDPVRLACLKLIEVFENAWVTSGLCAEVQRAKRATAGIAAPKFEPEEYDGAGVPPRRTTSHRSGEQQQQQRRGPVSDEDEAVGGCWAWKRRRVNAGLLHSNGQGWLCVPGTGCARPPCMGYLAPAGTRKVDDNRTLPDMPKPATPASCL